MKVSATAEFDVIDLFLRDGDTLIYPFDPDWIRDQIIDVPFDDRIDARGAYYYVEYMEGVSRFGLVRVNPNGEEDFFPGHKYYTRLDLLEYWEDNAVHWRWLEKLN